MWKPLTLAWPYWGVPAGHGTGGKDEMGRVGDAKSMRETGQSAGSTAEGAPVTYLGGAFRPVHEPECWTAA